jgi:hypothetical protein
LRVAEDALQVATDADAPTVQPVGLGAVLVIEPRRNVMMTKSALRTTVVAMTVLAGGARVEARAHGPQLLATNDRALVAPALPPLVVRAPLAAATAKGSAKAAPSARPAATPAAPTAAKQPSKDEIRTAMRAVLGELKQCYETALESDPTLKGNIVVHIQLVNQDGKAHVAEAEVKPQGEGDLIAPVLEHCVLAAIANAKMPLPAASEPLVIDYPFSFATTGP